MVSVGVPGERSVQGKTCGSHCMLRLFRVWWLRLPSRLVYVERERTEV